MNENKNDSNLVTRGQYAEHDDQTVLQFQRCLPMLLGTMEEILGEVFAARRIVL